MRKMINFARRASGEDYRTNKQRRRYELKLSRFGPKSRTVFIASVVLLVLAIGGTAFGRELRVTTAQDLLACADPATYGPLTSGPDAGITSAQGDICVVSPGTYNVPATVVVALRSLTIRSRNGAAVTIIQGATPVFRIERDNVTIGGNAADQGLTITGSGGPGIEIGGGGTPPGEADQDITIQNNFITANGGDGVLVSTNGAIKTFRFESNEFRGNGGNGILFSAPVTTVGGSDPEEGVWITGNTFDTNNGDGIQFGNSSAIKNLTISGNKILRNGDNGILFGTGVTSIETVSIAENIIQQNGYLQANIGAGVAFLNAGDIEELSITNNKDSTGGQGITGNWGPGILFDGTGTFAAVLPVAGGAVAEINNTTIEGNVISDNGGGGTLLLLDGIAFFNGADISGLKLKGNTFRLNAGNGVLLANNGDFSDSEVAANLFRNNGTNPFAPSYGDGFAAVVNGDISQITFSGNESRENAVRGVFLGSATGDIDAIRFVDNNQFNKNGLGLAPGTIPGTTGHGLELASFGDISEIELKDIVANQNGGSGVLFDALGNALAAYFFTPPFPGDATDITVSAGSFSMNGASAPIGSGNGLAISGETVRVITITDVNASTNDDHGVLVNAIEDLTTISVEESEFSGNDRNHDSIGTGIFLDATEDMDSVVVRGNKLNSNQQGIHFAIKGGNGRDITVENNTEINENSEEGIFLDASGDLFGVDVLNNTLSENGLGIRVAVTKRGSDILLKGNRISGTSGTGILLNSSGVTITENDIRGQDIGIKVNKLEDNQIRQNNIVARHGRFGMDATGLGPGEEIDATNNWWGEPSGPFHPTKNPKGAGSEVSDKVRFDPWLREPAVKTGAYFEVTELTVSPTSLDVGAEVTITAKITNSGSEEGTEEVKLTITSGGSIVNQDSKTATVNKDATTTIVFKYKPSVAGSYEVKVAADTSKSGAFTVKGGLKTIEQAVAQHSGSATVIEDADILWAIDLWIKDQQVPDTGGQKISDATLLNLIDMWVKGSAVSAAATRTAPQGFWGWLANFFAARSVAAIVNRQASPSRVAPGETFTVTVQVSGEVNGLLLTESLPAGWTIRPVEGSSGGVPHFYKPSETKWLVLGAGTLSYKVTVPADARPGTYTITGFYRTSDGSGALAPLAIEVAGTPAPLKVERISFTGTSFIVEGVGVASLEARVWNLAGSLVFHSTASGNVLALNGAALANGVYLYTVTVKGAAGQVLQTEVRKLLFLK
jgi:hypothetical protein